MEDRYYRYCSCPRYVLIMNPVCMVFQLRKMDTDDYGLGENQEFYDEFSVEDVGLNFDDYNEFFSNSRNHSENLFDDAEIDSMFDVKNTSTANENGMDEFSAEVSFCLIFI